MHLGAAGAMPGGGNICAWRINEQKVGLGTSTSLAGNGLD